MISDKIKALLNMKGKKYNELATLFEISPQAMRNKFARGSFSADELIMIADFLDCQLSFEIDNIQKVILTTDDLRKPIVSISTE
ncbi:helix-turn-helix domain-containing protein [Lachnospiraceae bacterium OttesenSCG-928-D06]|nr:helix-turn-helix domain-containing protein [Lachnospiraceae bacterium OttesenSCG-928-D06]